MRWIRIVLSGGVQGLGVRPAVHRHAQVHRIVGAVRNTPQGVLIEAGGQAQDVDRFLKGLCGQMPALARIDHLSVSEMDPLQVEDFAIETSQTIAQATTLIPPDLAVCNDCRRELFDTSDRRYRYPFINCTACGPRYSVIETLPYDRARTTMCAFPLCADCLREYHDPSSRRFHAEATCCQVCGPRLRFISAQERHKDCWDEAALAQAIKQIKQGRIAAIKGLGGYHLACDPLQAETVAVLRARKRRPHKPFALMARNLEVVETLVDCDCAWAQELLAPSAPILLLPNRHDALAELVAPGNGRLGVMLPYTPLHVLLMEHFDALVMTSANLRDEPLIADDARLQTELLGPIADCALVHDRVIARPCDDSIFLAHQTLTPIRRARGYVPSPIKLDLALPPILAVGGDLKSAFALSRGNQVFFSPHQGDLGEAAASQAFERNLEDFRQFLEVRPRICAHDLHPAYHATQWALATPGLEKVGVQHHEAHLAACAAEHGHWGPLIGVAWDGTGFGKDGAVWGGEFFAGVSPAALQRMGHLEYLPLPGGDAAIRQPWRTLLSCLTLAGCEDPLGTVMSLGEIDPSLCESVAWLCKSGAGSLTSSAGRLFDAVAVAAGLGTEATFEGHLAIALESVCGHDLAQPYPYRITELSNMRLVSLRPMWPALLRNRHAGIPIRALSGRFHATMAAVIGEMVEILAEETGIRTVALSGGVFQNSTLLALVQTQLEAARYRVLSHRLVPPNDGGLALGQLVIAALQC